MDRFESNLMEGRMAAAKAEVSVGELRSLIEWCADAIDFKNDSDRQAAKAFRTIVREADLRFHHGLLGNL